MVEKMIDEVGEGLAEETRTLAERLFSILPPAFRPRTLALGQAVMQRPTFSTSKTMLKNLLSFNALLDQYSMAAGSPMAEDLIVGTVFRCIDPVTRKHLQYNMPDVALGTTTAGGPRPMDVDNVALRERANIKESRRGKVHGAAMVEIEANAQPQLLAVELQMCQPICLTAQARSTSPTTSLNNMALHRLELQQAAVARHKFDKSACTMWQPVRIP
ncbi:unnamed protein product [Durusdinium trenchii]|uniref:Uncharacterized protein n=1 Tax=Durusdinium trenchii TaxID=1381693 RepID=A0ABP0J5E7_9DINO